MNHLRPVGLALVTAMAILGCQTVQKSASPASGGSSSSAADTVVAEYADRTITLAELDSAYAATVGGPENAADSSLSSYRNFLDQYVNFRVKVRAARDAGLDTLDTVREDISKYRQQMARPRLMRKEVYEPVVRTLYERRKEVVDVSHIMIEPSSENDTLEAYRTLEQIVDSLEQGVPFGELAYRHSDDPSAQKKGQPGYRGHLGYIRAGQVVEPFEKRMYALSPGTVSEIFRTQYGFHVIKVHDRRPAKNDVHLAHVLIRSRGDTAQTRHFVDSLRTEIVQGGARFSGIAERHSEDRRSAEKGGDLGTASPRDLPAAFNRALANMDSVGAVSDVVRTRFGYHLIKLLGREDQKSFEEAYDELKNQVSGRPRVTRQKKAFSQSVRNEVGASVDTARILAAANRSSVDSLARPLLSRADSTVADPRPIATIGDSTYTVRQIARHLSTTDGGAQMTVGDLIESFLDEKAFSYAGARLAQRDPAFAREMKKYREGVLLFQFMQDSVWTAAAQDTAGLRSTFRKNRDEYRYPERIRTVVLRSPIDSLLQPFEQMHQTSKTLASVARAAERDSLVSVDTVMVSEASADVYQSVRSVADGAAIGPTKHQNDWLFLMRDTKLPPRRKTFDEARSSVIQDYQNAFEEKVVKRLRARYDVNTYPERVRPPFGGTPPTQ